MNCKYTFDIESFQWCCAYKEKIILARDSVNNVSIFLFGYCPSRSYLCTCINDSFSSLAYLANGLSISHGKQSFGFQTSLVIITSVFFFQEFRKKSKLGQFSWRGALVHYYHLMGVDIIQMRGVNPPKRNPNSPCLSTALTVTSQKLKPWLMKYFTA